MPTLQGHRNLYSADTICSLILHASSAGRQPPSDCLPIKHISTMAWSINVLYSILDFCPPKHPDRPQKGTFLSLSSVYSKNLPIVPQEVESPGNLLPSAIHLRKNILSLVSGSSIISLCQHPRATHGSEKSEFQQLKVTLHTEKQSSANNKRTYDRGHGSFQLRCQHRAGLLKGPPLRQSTLLHGVCKDWHSVHVS